MQNKPFDIIKRGTEEIINEDTLIKKLSKAKFKSRRSWLLNHASQSKPYRF